MNHKNQQRIFSLYTYLFSVSVIFVSMAIFIFSFQSFEYLDYDGYKTIVVIVFMALSIISFYFYFYAIRYVSDNQKIFEIKYKLTDQMYQQFDAIDLTVFNTEYFDSEEEVLNFILTQLPSWFINCDAESLYECIDKGYLLMNDGKQTITKKRKTNALEVFYIKG